MRIATSCPSRAWLPHRNPCPDHRQRGRGAPGETLRRGRDRRWCATGERPGPGGSAATTGSGRWTRYLESLVEAGLPQTSGLRCSAARRNPRPLGQLVAERAGSSGRLHRTFRWRKFPSRRRAAESGRSGAPGLPERTSSVFCVVPRQRRQRLGFGRDWRFQIRRIRTGRRRSTMPIASSENVRSIRGGLPRAGVTGDAAARRRSRDGRMISGLTGRRPGPQAPPGLDEQVRERMMSMDFPKRWSPNAALCGGRDASGGLASRAGSGRNAGRAAAQYAEGFDPRRANPQPQETW